MPSVPRNPAAKAARQILSRIRAIASRGKSQNNSAKSPQGTIPANLKKHLHHYAWTAFMLRIMVACLTVMLISTLALWVGVYKLGEKPPVLVRAGDSLKAKAGKHFRLNETTYDSVAHFIVSTLPLLHSVDDGGHPMLPLTRGRVSNKIYQASEEALDRDMPTIRKNLIHQHLQINRVMNVLSDKETNRVAAYVKGYLVVAIQKGRKAPVFIPYRAHVILESNPPSKLNSSPYFMIQKEERIDKSALRWDAEMLDRQAELLGGGKK